MADTDISFDEASVKKTVSVIPTPFEEWAAARGRDITSAVVPDSLVYADRRTQEAYEGKCCNGAAQVTDRLAKMRRKRPALFRGRHFEAELIIPCDIFEGCRLLFSKLAVEARSSCEDEVLWRVACNLRMRAGAPYRVLMIKYLIDSRSGSKSAYPSTS